MTTTNPNPVKTNYCHCGKTGLYRVGPRSFCKAHKADALTQRAKTASRLDHRAGGFEVGTFEFERVLTAAERKKQQHANAVVRKRR